VHGNALRRSVCLPPGKEYLTSADYDEPHRCGEVLGCCGPEHIPGHLGQTPASPRRRVELGPQAAAAEEGTQLAQHLLNVCIRAIDYCPPTDILFGDFASALLTVDAELNPGDTR